MGHKLNTRKLAFLAVSFKPNKDKRKSVTVNVLFSNYSLCAALRKILSCINEELVPWLNCRPLAMEIFCSLPKASCSLKLTF